MNKDFFYWKTEKMPLENLWQFQKQNFEEIFKKHPLIVFRNNKKYVKSKKKQLSKLLKLSSHPTQYLTLSHNKLVPMYAPFLCFTQKSCPNLNLNNWFVKKFVLNVPPGVYIPAVWPLFFLNPNFPDNKLYALFSLKTAKISVLLA